MPARPLQTNFTAGELSRQLDLRVDYQRYRNGAERLKNCVVRTTGGASRRAGSYHVNEVGDSSKIARLVPFVFSATVAYVLELQPGAIRIYRDRAILKGQGDGVELVTNGTFNVDLAGWTITNQGTGSTVWNAGKARLNGGAAGSTRLAQAVTTVIDAEYILTFQITLAPISLQVGTADGLADVRALQSFPVGRHKLKIRAPAASLWLQFLTGDNGNRDLDDVSCQLAAPTVLASPYGAADLQALRFDQLGDVIYFFHEDHATRKLLRLSDIEWELRPVFFQPPPSAVIKRFPPVSLTPGAVTGTGVSFTVSSSFFLAGDRNKIIQAGAGRASIVTVVSATEVTVDIIDDFSSTDPIGPGGWSILGSPFAGLTPSAKEPEGAIITLTADAAAFRAGDVGSFVTLHGGLVELTTFTSATSVKGEIRRVLSSVVAAVAGAWQLEDPVWTADLGFPAVGTFHEQRLVVARKDTFWGSVTGDFENYALGSNPDDAYEFTPAASQINEIRWLRSGKELLLGTIGQEFTARGPTDTSIGPDAPPVVVPWTDYGSDFFVDAVKAGHTVLFAQRGATRIREFAFTFETDGFVAADLSQIADHLFHRPVLQLARMRTPASVIFAVREDGLLLVCAYERPENVVAWTRWVTGPAQDLSDGQYESATVIPNRCGTVDELWVVVRRKIGHTFKRFVEVFDGALQLDCAVAYTGLDPIQVLTGLGHLEGLTVQVVADGAFYTRTVSGGKITLQNPASTVQAGFGYIARIRPMRLEMPLGDGTLQFRRQHANKIFVRFYCTGRGVRINGSPITLTPGKLVEDWAQVNLGWDHETQPTIEQAEPFAMTVLGIGFAAQAEDG